jgi:FkbM family methyltransferase
MTVTNRLKIIMQIIVKLLFKFLPNSTIRFIILSFPKLAVCAPPNLKFIINNYLDRYTVNINTASCVERYMLRGTYEPSNLKIIELNVKEGNCCLDIGANVGAITLALAKAVGKSGLIYSFEPHPSFYNKLSDHIKINNLENNVFAINKGISSSNKNIFLEEDSRIEGKGNAGIVDFETINSYKIEAITLDQFVISYNLKSVNFIKIDVEGHEMEVINGCVETIKKFRPKILFESLSIFAKKGNKNNFSELENQFISLNYDFFGVDYYGNLIKISTIGEYPMTYAIPIN